MAVAKVTEITAGSKKSFQDAIDKGIARASKTLKNITGAWVQQESVVCKNGKITEYRVNMKVTFVLKG
ncbi:MAG: dodecin domain-containing protein [bacterium]|nr:dodecin domain-containing protein [bacterium]